MPDSQGSPWLRRALSRVGGESWALGLKPFAPVVAVVFVFALVGGGASSNAAEPTTTCATGTPEAARASGAIVAAANLFRRSQSLRELAENRALAEVAARYARFLCEHDRLAHETEGGFDASDRVGLFSRRLFFLELGENLYQQSMSRGGALGLDLRVAASFGREAQRAWEDSPGHRRNLLIPTFNSLGIGVAHARDRFYAVQLLATLAAELGEDLPRQQDISELQSIRLLLLMSHSAHSRHCLLQSPALAEEPRLPATELVCRDRAGSPISFDYRLRRPGMAQLSLRLPDGRVAVGPRFVALDGSP